MTFTKRAPRAVSEIRKFATKMMKTRDVRLDVKLNKAVWSQGVRNVPTKLRVSISRRRAEDEDAKDDFYSYVALADDPETKGKGTVVVDEK